MKYFYSDSYHVDIGSHVFPTDKYKLIRRQLLDEGIADIEDFIEPEEAKDEDILLVHTWEYIQKLKNQALTPADILKLELPYSEELVTAAWICAGGTIAACEYSLEHQTGVHIGGGFHHAMADHGEGFCVLNDIAIGIRKLQKEGRIQKSLVVDCDLHHGNGTAAIFSDDRDVYTFSIHQQNNYPQFKPHSNLDIGLEDRTSDDIYLANLKENIPPIINNFRPDLLIYVAGADPYKRDQLGGLALSIEGLRLRDELVIGKAREKNVPVAVVLAGGYAVNVNDTVTIHTNTIKTALKFCKE